MHKTLQRQIKHAFGTDFAIPAEWQGLFDTISSTYEGFDKDRELIERSLEISSTELKELVALLQATLDSIEEGILVVDKDNRIVNYNKRALEIWEVTAEILKLDGEAMMSVFLDKVLNTEETLENFKQTLSQGSESKPYLIHLKDGRVIETNSNPQIMDKKVVGRVWMFIDITARLEIERQLKVKLSTLERLNRAMVDRELKMVDLKKTIKQLEAKIQATN